MVLQENSSNRRLWIDPSLDCDKDLARGVSIASPAATVCIVHLLRRSLLEMSEACLGVQASDLPFQRSIRC